jgi:hypothetical protein
MFIAGRFGSFRIDVDGLAPKIIVGKRNFDRENRAFVRCRTDLDPVTEEPRDPLDDGKAKT